MADVFNLFTGEKLANENIDETFKTSDEDVKLFKEFLNEEIETAMSVAIIIEKEDGTFISRTSTPRNVLSYTGLLEQLKLLVLLGKDVFIEDSNE
jgi:hypothetical protein